MSDGERGAHNDVQGDDPVASAPPSHSERVHVDGPSCSGNYLESASGDGARRATDRGEETTVAGRRSNFPGVGVASTGGSQQICTRSGVCAPLGGVAMGNWTEGTASGGSRGNQNFT